MIGELVTGKFGEEVCGQTSLEKNTYEGIFVLCECSPKVTLAEEDFNDQLERMTHSVDTSQPLFMTSFVILTQWAHEQSAMVTGMEVCLNSLTWTSTHQGLLCLGNC